MLLEEQSQEQLDKAFSKLISKYERGAELQLRILEESTRIREAIGLIQTEINRRITDGNTEH